MNPIEIYEKLKFNYPNLGYNLEYKGKESHVNIYNSHKNTKYPLFVSHFEEGYENEDEIKYLPNFEFYRFIDEWMCRKLDETLPIIYKFEYNETCFKINELVIGGESYPCVHTETFTPNDTESICEAFDNCLICAMEKFHILSHSFDRFLIQHPELECLVQNNDKKVVKQIFNIFSHFSSK